MKKIQTNNLTGESEIIDILDIEQYTPTQTVSEKRQQAFTYDPCVLWGIEPITVDEANKLFAYYKAEDDEVRATQLQVLIKAEKDRIRELYK